MTSPTRKEDPRPLPLEADTLGALERLIAGIVRQQQQMRTRDPWLPRREEKITDALRKAWESGALVLVSEEAGVVGVLETDRGVHRLLGPVVEQGAALGAQGRRLLALLEADPRLEGSLVKVAVNSEFEELRQLLQAARFRRYNAEMSLTIGREEWRHQPSRGLPRSPRRVLLRPFRETDSQELSRLHPEQAYYSAEVVARRSLEGAGSTLVAEQEARRRLLGYLYYEVEGEGGEICFVNVDENARGEGIGTRLIAEALNHLFADPDLGRVDISVRPDNPAADLYRRIGFAPVATCYSYERRF
ncbi:MAG: GNAT family N-acetyltransferase [Spirochaetaceae bacterium]